MALPTLHARRLHTDIGTIEFPVITLADDGAIADISSDPRTLAKETSTLTAAFLDIHIHGAMGHDVMQPSREGLQRMQRFIASRGVAHYLPTTVTAPIDDTLRALEALADTIERPGEPAQAQPIGIHLEGPFLSHATRGVPAPDELPRPSIELFDRFYAAARGHILMMTIAPELPGALELIAYAKSLGVKLSLGHTYAAAIEALAGIDAGATSATHTFNAMRALDHREPGVLGIVLDDERLFAEMICDGIHVAPPLIRFWLKAKGFDRAILVTDAISATGMPDGDALLGQLAVHVAQGRALLIDDLLLGKETLAGSVLTMDRAVANLQKFTSAPLETAVGLASNNPATMLGRPELTRIAVGSIANFNRFDEHGKLVATYIRGQHMLPQA